MRLQLTRRGDYGVRAMLALARTAGARMSGNEIAADANISRFFVTQVMGDLVRAGLVEARTGRAGGYRLVRPAGDISILAIVTALEGDTRRRSCVLSATPCRREDACEVHDIFGRAQEALIERLSEATLAEALGTEEVALV
jgi:Rrf2 family protein